MPSARVRKRGEDAADPSDAPVASKKPRTSGALSRNTSSASASTSRAAASSQTSSTRGEGSQQNPAASSSRLATSSRGGRPAHAAVKSAGRKPSTAGKQKASRTPELEHDRLELVGGNGSSARDVRVRNQEDAGNVEPDEDPEAQLGQLLSCSLRLEAHISTHLERLMKKWTAGVYGLYEVPVVAYPPPTKELAHAFRCAARGCKKVIHRYVGTKDVTSTSNLWRHATSCWGEDAVKAARSACDVEEVRKISASIKRNGSITDAFERKTDVVTYSHRPFTRIETRTELVKWFAENLRPFRIVRDRGFLVLMKTGRPGYYIPSPSTVSRDVKVVFARTRRRVARFLRVSCQFPLVLCTAQDVNPYRRNTLAV